MAQEIDDIIRDATVNLAILIRFADAEGRSERHGHSPELDSDAWYGIEQLLSKTRRDIKRLPDLIAKGGAR